MSLVRREGLASAQGDSMRSKLLGFFLALVAVFGLAHQANAFCGFYVAGADDDLVNKATMVVMMRDGTRTVLSMQNNYEGPPENFAMIVPVPEILQEENVKILPADVFDRVDTLAAPRLVEYWEQDPCFVPRPERRRSGRGMPTASAAMEESAEPDSMGVTVEAEFAVGEYDIVILSAQEANGLDAWLRANNYSIPEGAAEVLRPYVESGMKFFVAKVDVSKVRFENGRVTLSPLRFHYDSPTFSLPVRLGLLNSSGMQDLIVHILADNTRFELANYENVTVPTNLDVADDVRTRFGEFYAALFDETMRRNPRSVVTEYSWQASGCDPCPGPVLTASDLVTLGADTIPRLQGGDSRGGRFGGGPLNNFVITRLHTRYSRESLDEDLVFRRAGAIAGGREHIADDNELETGAVDSSVNNFQARYAIRHEWTGPITCDSPVRGRWGGPPSGIGNIAAGRTGSPQPARDLAYAARGAIQLTSAVPAGIPELNIAATPVAPAVTPPAENSAPPEVQGAGGATTRVAESVDAGGCGCRIGGHDLPPLSLLLLGSVLFFRSRRRTR